MNAIEELHACLDAVEKLRRSNFAAPFAMRLPPHRNHGARKAVEAVASARWRKTLAEEDEFD